MKVKLITKSAGESFGRGDTRFYPNCNVSRALTEALKKKCLNQNDAELLIRNGFKIEYSGPKNESLDSLGAKRTGIDEEQ